MANSQQMVNDLRDLAVELADVLDRIEAKIAMSDALGGDTAGVGWLQQLSTTEVLTGTLPEGLTKTRFLELLGTFAAFKALLDAGHRTNIARWRW